VTNSIAQSGFNVFSGEWWQSLTRKDFDWQLLSPMVVVTIGAFLTLGIYSLLYRENKFYRLVEHIFVGLAAGYAVVAAWTNVLADQWYDPMMGRAPDGVLPMVLSRWAWAILLPIGVLGLFVFSRKAAWLSRIPIGIILGLWAGQQFSAFQEEFLPQLASTAYPVIPNHWGIAFQDMPVGTLTVTQAISNIIVICTFILVLSYFLYSFEQKNKLVQKGSLYGRWLLMIGLGAIFGTTMMTRFVLFIDRAYFLLVEWLKLAPPL
jgi:hypothetical protein